MKKSEKLPTIVDSLVLRMIMLFDIIQFYLGSLDLCRILEVFICLDGDFAFFDFSIQCIIFLLCEFFKLAGLHRQTYRVVFCTKNDIFSTREGSIIDCFQFLRYRNSQLLVSRSDNCTAFVGLVNIDTDYKTLFASAAAITEFPIPPPQEKITSVPSLYQDAAFAMFSGDASKLPTYVYFISILPGAIPFSFAA